MKNFSHYKDFSSEQLNAKELELISKFVALTKEEQDLLEFIREEKILREESNE